MWLTGKNISRLEQLHHTKNQTTQIRLKWTNYTDGIESKCSFTAYTKAASRDFLKYVS